MYTTNVLFFTFLKEEMLMSLQKLKDIIIDQSKDIVSPLAAICSVHTYNNINPRFEFNRHHGCQLSHLARSKSPCVPSIKKSPCVPIETPPI
jgi:hypothetical protein